MGFIIGILVFLIFWAILHGGTKKKQPSPIEYDDEM